MQLIQDMVVDFFGLIKVEFLDQLNINCSRRPSNLSWRKSVSQSVSQSVSVIQVQNFY